MVKEIAQEIISQKRLGRQQLGLVLGYTRSLDLQRPGSPSQLQDHWASVDLEAVRVLHGSNTASIQPNDGFLDYMMATMQSGWLACISKLMRTHCPFSCSMVYNFPEKGQLQGKGAEI